MSSKTYSTARGQINQIQVMELAVQQVAQNGEMANIERLQNSNSSNLCISRVRGLLFAEHVYLMDYRNHI